MNKYLTSFTLLSLGSLYGVVEKTIDEKTPLEITFSTTSHNRISVESGSVEKIFGDETVFQVTIDHTTGNAFINMNRPIETNPITLTVVTNGGLIQDLSILAKEIPSEHLILKEDEHETLTEITTSFQNHSIELLNTILQGKIPRGYGEQTLDEGQALSLPSPLSSSLIKSIEGPFDIIKIYKVRNSGKHPVVLSPEVIKNEEMSWVFLNGHELRAREEVLCLISFSKQEGGCDANK